MQRPEPFVREAGTRPRQRMARILAPALPQVETVEFKGLGHRGPVTHPEQVNEVIARFVQRCAQAAF